MEFTLKDSLKSSFGQMCTKVDHKFLRKRHRDLATAFISCVREQYSQHHDTPASLDGCNQLSLSLSFSLRKECLLPKTLKNPQRRTRTIGLGWGTVSCRTIYRAESWRARNGEWLLRAVPHSACSLYRSDAVAQVQALMVRTINNTMKFLCIIDLMWQNNIFRCRKWTRKSTHLADDTLGEFS